MFCNQCGKEIPDDATFCNYCGAPVGVRMAHCRNCGALIPESATVCPRCGAPAGGPAPEEDKPEVALNVLSFFIPIVGLILYCVNVNKTPKKAKEIGKWALIGFVTALVLGLISRTIALSSAGY